MAHPTHWQVQEAKQRFSEVLRAVEDDGPQTITRHGDEVAVVIDIQEYRRLTGGSQSAWSALAGPPYFDDDMIEVMDEIEAARKKDFGREVDLGIAE
ncbi:prevent-host-death family protein [Herbihabitans rhizosphaerae]|uniref:Antitoxin n=1 Tax=Herbihabitans rhizosphaerae TaxID=1872711 RepID=A0A4Q7KM54_9PSEU|nr:type II toxin-antitoxin system Phd/YefM family antitoxin [Herbihabitans rhizosphaerae]RZS37749.1 prevent-host-death family protein [Herbihabitans rhizosphaerae]